MRIYKDYNSSLTIKYKSGYIHTACFGSDTVVRVKVDAYAYPLQVKSVHAAKVLITKHVKSGRALNA